MSIERLLRDKHGVMDNDYKSLLSILERTNPCDQEYHMENGTFIVSYRMKVNILSLWKRWSLHKKVNLVGLPMSISRPGYIGSEQDVEEFLKRQKGLWIVLNGEKEFSTGGQTLSTFIFHNRFASFDHYLEALRSPYRRRLRKALEMRKNLVIGKGNFTRDHYELYLDVVKRSKHPLEILPFEFFKEIQGQVQDFKTKDGRLLGFTQTMTFGKELIFLFCGFKREDSKEHDLYFNMLLWIVQQGIDLKVQSIDFGQTSEESKLKLGCFEKKLFLHVHHHNGVLGWLLGKLAPYFAYKPYEKIHRPFREEYYADIS